MQKGTWKNIDNSQLVQCVIFPIDIHKGSCPDMQKRCENPIVIILSVRLSICPSAINSFSRVYYFDHALFSVGLFMIVWTIPFLHSSIFQIWPALMIFLACVAHGREKEGDLTHYFDKKNPYTNRKFENQWTKQKLRLHNDCGPTKDGQLE